MVQKTEQQNGKVEAQQNSKQTKLEAYFEQNSKFFGSNDSNGKKAFFCLGQYTRRVMEAEEKKVAESGEENKFQKKIVKQIGYNMSYRNFGLVIKLLDGEALTVNPDLFTKCSGACKQFIINSECVSDKKALKPEDANLAFSLGMYQKF
ncbi:hypothetical protein [Methanosarcina sp.]|uniref:hypothetical protein n=1 Tax=Methanosarcina sp. TaxID=2213 RepID=UPI002B8AB449|nr:hypothetical protein [Methanosarcina sp.]HOW13493.1 hypothetical protein [Methanosarcina sp.]